MSWLVANGAEVAFEPGPGWAWHGWTGRLPLQVLAGPLSAEGKKVATATDLTRLAVQLAGRSYTATGFSASPGAILKAVLTVDPASLSQTVRVGGQACVDLETRGRFTVACLPALGTGAPPPPDPEAAARTGEWRVVLAGQASLNG